MAPGFKARLLDELRHLLQHPKYSSKLALKTFKFHKPPAKENYVAWLGGKNCKHKLTCSNLNSLFSEVLCINYVSSCLDPQFEIQLMNLI